MWYHTEEMNYESNSDFDKQLTDLAKDGWKPIWIKELVYKKGSGGVAIVKFEINDK